MLSDLDKVILAMVNRERQTVDDLKTEQRIIEVRNSSSGTSTPRPKGARVYFKPSSTPEMETR